MGRTKAQLQSDAEHAWGMFEQLLPECTTLGDAQEQAHWLITDNGLDGYISRKETFSSHMCWHENISEGSEHERMLLQIIGKTKTEAVVE